MKKQLEREQLPLSENQRMESIDETWALNWEGGKGIQRMGSHKIKREREIYVKKGCKPDIWFKLNRLSSPPLFITQFKTGKG